jgi:hypothetical protein
MDPMDKKQGRTAADRRPTGAAKRHRRIYRRSAGAPGQAPAQAQLRLAKACLIRVQISPVFHGTDEGRSSKSDRVSHAVRRLPQDALSHFRFKRRRWGEAERCGSLFGRLKRQVKADYNSKGQVKWRREAREDFDFDAGEQLNEDDKAILQDAKRPIVIFNRVGTTVDSVAGEEVANRQEVQVLPRRLGVAKEKRAADVSGEVVSPAMRR